LHEFIYIVLIKCLTYLPTSIEISHTIPYLLSLWFILISSYRPTLFYFFFFFFFKEPHSLAQHKFFWNIGHSTIEATFWTTYCKLEINVLTFFYIREGWTLGVYGIKLKWHWECLEKPMGTWWEHSANTLGTQEKTKNISPLF
jgi:hypothetical protein